MQAIAPCRGTHTEERTIVRNIHAPFAARRFARRMITGWRLPGLLDAAEIITSELASNAFQHAVGDTIEVRLVLCEGVVTVKLWDADSERYPIMLCGDPAEESGRGLVLVDALSQKWGSFRAKPTGKVVWAQIGGASC